MKDHAHGVAMSGSQPAHSVPETDAIGSARAVHRTVVDCEHHGIAPAQRHHLGPRLHAWPLLGQHEFTAGEIPLRLRQQNRELQRKDMLAVEILVQSVVVSGAVLQQERRGPRLPRLVAAREELGMRVDADTTFGVYAPAGVSAAIIERMNREITRTLNSPALVDNMARLGGEVAPMTIQEFVSRQAADRARYGAFIKEAGIKVD